MDATQLARGAQDTPDLPESVFEEIAELTRRVAGISLGEGKRELVRSRLAKRLRALGLPSYRDYLVTALRDKAELGLMVDALTTNKTSFFREARHFEVLANQILSKFGPHGLPKLRGWSAASSTGEEPYSIAMLVREHVSAGVDARILATDISKRVLAQAKEGLYAETLLEPLPDAMRRRHFVNVTGKPGFRAVAPETRALVRYGCLNLVADWPIKGPFDFIFCRNVMIYFDKDVQERLVGRFHDLLVPGGRLFIGLAESLTGMRHGYRFEEPGVYVK